MTMQTLMKILTARIHVGLHSPGIIALQKKSNHRQKNKSIKKDVCVCVCDTKLYSKIDYLYVWRLNQTQ